MIAASSIATLGYVGTRTLTLHKLTLFSLAHLFTVPCALSGNTSLKMPVRVGAALPARRPTHGAMTRYCRRIVSSVAKTLSLSTLSASGGSNCLGM